MIDVVTFNVWTGQHPEALRDNLGQLVDDTEKLTRRPLTALALQEAKRFDGTLPGFTRVACDEGPPDSSEVVLLVRKHGVKLLHEHTVRVDDPAGRWVGPKHGRRHPPHVWPGATIEDETGQRWVLLAVHRLAGRGRNPEAWAAEHATLVKWANTRHEGRPLGMFGDWNSRAYDPRRLSVGFLARDIRAETHLKGIDGAVVRDCRATARKLRSKYGSDAHRPVLHTLERIKS